MDRDYFNGWTCNMGWPAILGPHNSPHDSIAKSWEWDRGHVLSTWEIVFDVTVAFRDATQQVINAPDLTTYPYSHALS